MVLNIKRFTKNNFFVEKNPTIVNFPVKNLELKDVIPVPKGKNGQEMPSKYNLVANICHEGKHMEGTLKVHVHRKSEDAWYVPLLHAFPRGTHLSCQPVPHHSF
jgi:U4/U6.U5 tri-snRNP-associated protein 2